MTRQQFGATATGASSIEYSSPRSLSELAEAFYQAEQRLKTTEERTNRPVNSVINELRYAACHLLRAECPNIPQLDESFESQEHDPQEDDQTYFQREVHRATDHCKRAKYDAIEFDVIDCQERLSEFKYDYKQIIADDIEGLLAALKAANEAQRLLSCGKTQRARRERYLEALDAVCVCLREAYGTLDALRPVLNAKMARADSSNRKWKITTAIAVVAALAAIAKVAYSAPITREPAQLQQQIQRQR